MEGRIPQSNASKESPRMQGGILGTFLDVVARLFQWKPPQKSDGKTGNQNIRVVLIENPTLSMNHSELIKNEEGLIVRGSIAKKPGRLIPQGAHLHVVAVGAKGKAMLNDVVRCELSQLKRKDIKSIRYMAQFSTPLETVGLIKIIYHDHNHSQCTQWGCKKRR